MSSNDLNNQNPLKNSAEIFDYVSSYISTVKKSVEILISIQEEAKNNDELKNRLRNNPLEVLKEKGIPEFVARQMIEQGSDTESCWTSIRCRCTICSNTIEIH